MLVRSRSAAAAAMIDCGGASRATCGAEVHAVGDGAEEAGEIAGRLRGDCGEMAG